MATTPTYTFVTPDLASTADGPTALATLATRVEREMSTLRGSTEYTAEPNASYPAATNGQVIYTVAAPVSVIGYLDISANVNMVGIGTVDTTGGGTTFAGSLDLLADGAVLRHYRYHALWGTRTLALSLHGVVANTAAQTTRTLQLRIDTESGAAININHTAIMVAQIGAPGTG